MFKRFVNWLRGIRNDIQMELPSDTMQKLFIVNDQVRNITMGPLGVGHYDIIVDIRTVNIDELFMRLEVLINCLTTFENIPEHLDPFSRETTPTNLVEYFFDDKAGYRQPDEVLEILIEKVSIIHHQIEMESITDGHHYYHYMRKAFHAVFADTLELYEMCLRTGK